MLVLESVTILKMADELAGSCTGGFSTSKILNVTTSTKSVIIEESLELKSCERDNYLFMDNLTFWPWFYCKCTIKIFIGSGGGGG